MATKSKPSKAEINEATDMGMEARKQWREGEEMPKCDYDEGQLRTAWENGWRGQDEFEKKAIGSNTNADIEEELSSNSIPAIEEIKDQITSDIVNAIGVEQLEAHGHNVTDPEVELSRENLAQLMTVFDNHGVQIVEEQWRALTDNERTVSAMWVNSRQTDGTRSIPHCLMPFASDRLKQEVVDDVEEQEEFQTSLLSCEFGKPSRTKLDEGGNYRTNMKFRIPLDEVRPGRALEMWGDIRCRVEFGSLSTTDWKTARLPEMEDAAGEIYECEADVVKFGWTRTGWTFGFSVGESFITIEQANELWDGTRGSIRITPIGVPEKEEQEVDQESTAEMIAKARPLPSIPSGKSLFNDTDPATLSDNKKTNSDGEFIAPDEYIIPSHSNGCSVIITVGNQDGKYYAAGEAVFRNANDESIDASWGVPRKSTAGFASLTLAVSGMLATVIDWALKNDAIDAFLKDCRAELKQLDDGREPHLIRD